MSPLYMHFYTEKHVMPSYKGFSWTCSSTATNPEYAYDSNDTTYATLLSTQTVVWKTLTYRSTASLIPNSISLDIAWARSVNLSPDPVGSVTIYYAWDDANWCQLATYSNSAAMALKSYAIPVSGLPLSDLRIRFEVYGDNYTNPVSGKTTHYAAQIQVYELTVHAE